jgi:hypothetical protein
MSQKNMVIANVFSKLYPTKVGNVALGAQNIAIEIA